MDLALTCPTCSWIFVSLVEIAVPAHPDCLLGRACRGIGACVPCIDVSPSWRRAWVPG